MTLKTDGSSVAGGIWTTTQHMRHLKAGRSMYMRQQQPWRHGWWQLTAWWTALPDDYMWLSGPRYCGVSSCKTLYARIALCAFYSVTSFTVVSSFSHVLL